MSDVSIPESHKELFEKPYYAVLTTVMPDGQPQSSVVWVDYDGTFVCINTARGRQKEKNLNRNPKATVIIVDPQDPYRWLEVRGVVEEATETGARDLIEALSWKYTGQKYYGGYNKWMTPEEETRITYKIRPTRVKAYPSR